jgi:hypothetical protein
MWNWIEIKEIKDLPRFKHPVILYQEKDGKKYAAVGWLLSIDENGYKWGYNNNANDIVSIFSMMNTDNKNNFNPTHYCEIETPKVKSDKTTQTSGLSDFELECDSICDEIKRTENSLDAIGIIKRFFEKYVNDNIE